MLSIVVSTPDVVGTRMAGPGIRAYFLARELAKHFPTALIAQFEDFALTDEAFTAIQRNTAEARWALLEASVILGQPARELLALPRGERKFVYDLFDPTVLELRELYGQKPSLRQSVHYNREWGRLRMALQQGDLLVSADRRQRDFYTGIFCGFAGGSSEWLQRWVEIPFGVDEKGPGDEVAPLDDSRPWIVWGGGTWEWLDPLTAVRAVTLLNSRGIECRLLFMGGERPNSNVRGVGQSAGLRQAISGAGDAVVRNTEWVPFEERGRWLRAGRMAVMLHHPTLEAEFSIRTRLFDAIWAGLPIIATEGGHAADLVRREECGVVVKASEVESVASGMERLLTDNVFHAGAVSNLERLRPQFYWSNVTRPLVEAIRRWDT